MRLLRKFQVLGSHLKFSIFLSIEARCTYAALHIQKLPKSRTHKEKVHFSVLHKVKSCFCEMKKVSLSHLSFLQNTLKSHVLNFPTSSSKSLNFGKVTRAKRDNQ